VRPETVLNDGQRIFIFRQINGWTNISLESSEHAPKLTCDPITTLITSWREFSSCPHVSEVTIKWKGSDDKLSYDDIAGMEDQLDPLPEGTGEAEPDKTDADVLFDAISALSNKVDTNISALSKKLETIEQKVGLGEAGPSTPVRAEEAEVATAQGSKRRKTK
jgi:hypothetical protein